MRKVTICFLGIMVFFILNNNHLAFAQAASLFRYEVNATGTGLVITGFQHQATMQNYTSITIPASIDGVPVVQVGKGRAISWHDDKHTVSSIVLPNSVTVIGERAFEGIKTAWNSSLSIKMDGVQRIGAFAFYGCKLGAINLPNIVYIGAKAFSGCLWLIDVTLSNNIIIWEEDMTYGYIGKNEAFRSCVSLSVNSQMIIRRAGYKDDFGGY